MTNRPIIFSGPMVRALLAGTKTQTRRVLKAAVPEPPAHNNIVHPPKHAAPYLDSYCSQRPTDANPRGMSSSWCWWTRDNRCGEHFAVRYVPGDRLWVRETTIIAPPNWTSTPVNPRGPDRRETAYRADDKNDDIGDAARDYGLKATSSIYMPRWASRLTLTVTDVRVERLRDISEADAIAEGCKVVREHCYVFDGTDYDNAGLCHSRASTAYAILWDKINAANGKRWADNPWVVALTFAVAQRNIDDITLPAAQGVAEGVGAGAAPAGARPAREAQI